MASLITHPVVPVAIAVALGGRMIPLRIAALGILLSLTPDLDTIGFKYGIPYASPYGHRGFTHSIVFALAACFFAFSTTHKLSINKLTVLGFLFISAMSHSLLDAFTDVGNGVAFFWPVSNVRYFFPFHPVETSPLSVHRFIGPRGLEILASELKWIWLPCFVFAILGAVVRLNTERTNNDLSH